MRTHSLRTSHSSPVIEFEAGCAANDDCFVSDAMSLDARTCSNPEASNIHANSLHDEYVLGGYAGI